MKSTTVTPQGKEVVSGETLQFEAKLEDQNENIFPGTVTWSVKEGTTGSGEIDQNGEFKGTAAGPTTVVASVGSVKGTALVVVTPGPLDKITIWPLWPYFGPDDVITCTYTMRFTASCKDKYGNKISDIVLNWNSSDEVKGTIDAQGKFEARTVGDTDITAEKDPIRSNTVTVRVTKSDFGYTIGQYT